MSSRLNPYVSFSDNARQAMEFYQSVFGGELTVSTFGDLGAAEGEDAAKVMHSQLETGAGFTLMASDTPQHMDFTPGSQISISLSGDDAALRDYWEKLSAAGTVAFPLQKQSWGDEFGMIVDQFGINWVVNIGSPQQ